MNQSAIELSVSQQFELRKMQNALRSAFCAELEEMVLQPGESLLRQDYQRRLG